MSGALQAVFQNQRSFGPPPGSQSYTTNGTYSWVAPAGVTSVSVLVVGSGGYGANGYCCQGGGGGGGGSLTYANNLSVTPGSSYTVRLCQTGGFRNYFSSSTYLYANGGCNASCTTGGLGGTGGGTASTATYAGGKGGNSVFSCNANGGGGGGAAGYSGAGGNGGGPFTAGASAAACSGGAAGGRGGAGGGSIAGQGGGGVGILGKGATGSSNGAGGSGGATPNLAVNRNATPGGLYGGGGGGAGRNGCRAVGEIGAVRIVWPGNTRTYPSTCVGSP